MGKVMKADASADEAYVEFDLASDYPELWLTYRLAYDDAALAFWTSDGSSPAFDVFLPDPPVSQADFLNLFNDLGTMKWNDANVTGTADGAANTWHLVKHHITNGEAVQVYIDSVLVINTTDSSGVDLHYVDLGLRDVNPNAASIAYVDDVKVGTTEGGDDILADGFEDGTFDAWTNASGDVSIIDDPFASTGFANVPVFSVAFDAATLDADPVWTQIG